MRVAPRLSLEQMVLVDNPIIVPWLPMVDRNTTIGGVSHFERYNCAANTQERGPERIYRFNVQHAGTFVAQVRDHRGVDVDLHLLSGLGGLKTVWLQPASVVPMKICLSQTFNPECIGLLLTHGLAPMVAHYRVNTLCNSM